MRLSNSSLAEDRRQLNCQQSLTALVYLAVSALSRSAGSSLMLKQTAVPMEWILLDCEPSERPANENTVGDTVDELEKPETGRADMHMRERLRRESNRRQGHLGPAALVVDEPLDEPELSGPSGSMRRSVSQIMTLRGLSLLITQKPKESIVNLFCATQGPEGLHGPADR